jgi:demethylmenaquinone methyltransferase/2-methoxy-6-polyprenyl-1,4-benzoquinol methylase
MLTALFNWNSGDTSLYLALFYNVLFTFFQVPRLVEAQALLSNGKNITATKRNSSTISDRRTYTTEYVRSLFDGIAPRYDFLNHFLSSGIDVFWRRKAVGFLRDHHPQKILDIATGTGDLAIEASKLRPKSVIGIDIAPAMLDIARRKAGKKGLGALISFIDAQAENLPFAGGTFDAVTVGFGVRNFSHLESGLKEMVRVVRPGGVLVVLEFSRPRSALMSTLYGFYSERVLPFVGGSFSSKEAYEYLPSTIQEFPDGERFGKLLERAGVQNIRIVPLTFGIVTIYYGVKSGNSKRGRRD